MRLKHIFLLWLAVVAINLTVSVSKAAEPQPYSVHFDKTGDDRLDKILPETSTLISLQKTAEVGTVALIGRCKQDIARFITATQSLGYYKSHILLKIDGLNVDDPELLDNLANNPADQPADVQVSVELGPMFHLGRITLEGEFPAHSDEALSLKSGDKAEAELVLAARDKLLNVLHEDGYALAKIEEPIATLNEEAENVDVVFHVNSGSKVNLGQIRVNGLVKLNESFVRNRLLIKSGQPYKSTEIDAARVDLTGLGVFSSVRTGVAEQLDSLGKIPLDINVVERPLHAVNLGAAYATDVGGNLSGSWLHRNLFGNAEQLNLTAALTQLGGNSTTGIGYKVGASLNTPDYLARDQTLLLGLQAFQQNFQAYDETALVANLLLTRKLNAHWQFGYGIEAQQAQITQNDVIRNFTLFSLPVTLKYDSSDSPLNPVSGSIANIALTPIESLANVGQKTFLLMQVGASSYFDLAKSGWSVLAIRGLVGSSGGASQFELPPDKRFYAGGSSTVRGYKYQSIGPKFANNSPEGGSAIAAASVELRQKILDEYGIVAFADAGQVSVDGLPFSGGWQLGVGMGLRYYSSFGPIRVDVALPVNPQPGSGSYELYIGLGQAF